MEQSLLCCVEGTEDGKWEALCLNYDLSVEGESIDDALHNIVKAVDDYLEYVETLPQKEQSRFLRRGVPYFYKMKIFYWAICALIFHKANERLQRGRFVLPYKHQGALPYGA